MNFSDYFHAQHDYFWAWEDESEVLVINGGSTIGYRKEIADSLMEVAENGLPSFGAFLLVRIAINRTMGDGITQVGTIVDAYQHDASFILHKESFDTAFAFLRMLQALPEVYTAEQRRKNFLQTIFKDCHNRVGGTTSRGLVRKLQEQGRGTNSLQRKRDFNPGVVLKDFKTIALLNQQFPTQESIIRALQGVPELDEPDIPLPEEEGLEAKKYRDFIEALLDQPKAFHVVALIKPLWAGFKVPFFNAHPGAQPVGGVSDLTNKGDFDKLLISEFANDDLVFMNRLANNEALYIRREMPPIKDELHRTFLIDVSLKNWGTPKILAFAAYIAIARHPKSALLTRAFVLGNELAEVNCMNGLSIIDGIQKVDAGLHAAAGLTAFLEANKQDKNLELFYITSSEAIKHPAVQKILSMHYALFKYVIITDASGELSFYRRTNNTQKHLQTIRLPLEQLWLKKSKVTPENKMPEVQSSVLPSATIPILLCTPVEIRATIPFEKDVYIVANRCLYRRSLQQNEKQEKGWQLLLRNVPGNSNYELGRTQSGELLFLYFNLQNKHLCITNLDTMKQATTIFLNWSSRPYPQFLYSGLHHFIFLRANPDLYTFKPDFDKGTISMGEAKASVILFQADYVGRRQQIETFKPVYPFGSVLKNIKHIYITREGSLVVNRHRLRLDPEGKIGFSTKENHLPTHRSAKDFKTNTFSFRDGSKISVDPGGVLIMTSSNKAIPAIYMVPAMDMEMGMATETAFAGNPYFYNEQLASVRLILRSGGPEPLKVIKLLRESFAGLDLQTLQQIVYGAPKEVPGTIRYDQATRLISQLEAYGCQANIGQGYHESKFIGKPLFFEQHIESFINHIINHAPAD